MSGAPTDRADRATRALLRRVQRNLLDALGPGEGREIIAALSGGPDSSALLLALAEGGARTGWRPRAVHVDHRIADAEQRRRFRQAAARAAELAGAPLELRSVDAPQRERERGTGIEAAAREVRYEALAAAARERGAEVVAAAHTRDDQAETVLLRMLRGAQLDGLAGIRPLAPLPHASADVGRDIRLVRPMLTLTRAETTAICAAWGFAPVHDPANRDLRRLRNRVRRELLPRLRELNPQIDAALARLADGVGLDRDFLEQAAAAALAAAPPDDDGTRPRRALAALHPALRRRALRLLAAQASLELSAERTAAADALLRADSGEVELGGGLSLRSRRGRIGLIRRGGPRSPAGGRQSGGQDGGQGG